MMNTSLVWFVYAGKIKVRYFLNRPRIHNAVVQSTIPTNRGKFTMNITTVFTFCTKRFMMARCYRENYIIISIKIATSRNNIRVRMHWPLETDWWVSPRARFTSSSPTSGVAAATLVQSQWKFMHYFWTAPRKLLKVRGRCYYMYNRTYLGEDSSFLLLRSLFYQPLLFCSCEEERESHSFTSTSGIAVFPRPGILPQNRRARCCAESHEASIRTGAVSTYVYANVYSVISSIHHLFRI